MRYDDDERYDDHPRPSRRVNGNSPAEDRKKGRGEGGLLTRLDDKFQPNPEIDVRDLSFTQRQIYNLRKNWKLTVSGSLAVVLIITGVSVNGHIKAKRNEEEFQRTFAAATSTAPTTTKPSYALGVDDKLMKDQPKLAKRFGPAPENFIWDQDGTLLSLGDKSMEPDEVVYQYTRAISTLDFATVQKLSRKSQVFKRYSDFFDRKDATNLTSRDQFERNVYKQSLLSLQVTNVQRTANFSDNKISYTVFGRILDQSDKSFWNVDRDRLLDEMYISNKTEQDTAKRDAVVMNYVSVAYGRTVDKLAKNLPLDPNVDPKLKDFSFDVTLEKFPKQDTGWLVTIDKDLDLYASYSEGTSVVTYIKDVFREYSIDRRNRERGNS